MIFKVNYKHDNDIKFRVFDVSSIDVAIDSMREMKPNVKIVSVSDVNNNVVRTIPIIE